MLNGSVHVAKYTIVMFPDDTYGVQRKSLFNKSYLSTYNFGNWYENTDYIYEHCRFTTLKEAANALLFVEGNFLEGVKE